jgi:hypothetical protein
MTSVGIQRVPSLLSVHTYALRSCEHDTSLFVLTPQSSPVTSSVCYGGKRSALLGGGHSLRRRLMRAVCVSMVGGRADMWLLPREPLRT